MTVFESDLVITYTFICVSTWGLAPYSQSESETVYKTTNEDISTGNGASRTPEMEEYLPNEPEESTDVCKKNNAKHGSRDFGGKASAPLRRSDRESRPPNRFGDWTTYSTGKSIMDCLFSQTFY